MESLRSKPLNERYGLFASILNALFLAHRSNPEFKLAACESNMGLPRGLSGPTNFTAC
jgi:hypothetical protein